MQIETGQGKITLRTLVSVWTISAIISLPGLAVSPILGSLTKIFPDATKLEIEMLSSIPSLLIIPFILLSGYLSVGYNKVRMLIIGLIIFLISGSLCIFATSIGELIILSTILGAGAGMIIPLSTGFIAEFFVGKYRTAQLGISSAIANLTLVIATLVTGWLAGVNWHLPFVVYLLPVFALIMARFLEKPAISPEKQAQINDAKMANTVVKPGRNYNFGALAGTMLLYLVAGYVAVIVILNLSFIVPDSTTSGILTSLLFLAIMAPGLGMNRLRKFYGRFAVAYSLAMIAAGLLIIVLLPHTIPIGAAVLLVGFGYGFIQPLVYDKATQTSTPKGTIVTLAWVMAINYLTIVIAPFIVTGLNEIFATKNDSMAPFLICSILAIIAAAWAAIRSRHFVFSIEQ